MEHCSAVAISRGAGGTSKTENEIGIDMWTSFWIGRKCLFRAAETGVGAFCAREEQMDQSSCAYAYAYGYAYAFAYAMPIPKPVPMPMPMRMPCDVPASC